MHLYHGTPLYPVAALQELGGHKFCVPFQRRDNVRRCHEIGSGVMLDNGAFRLWQSGRASDWAKFYEWAERWLVHPTTWAVVPDVIEGDESLNDALLSEWPHGDGGAPVWHMHEGLDRLLRLIEAWPRVCIGSSAQYATVMAKDWQARMDVAWDAIMATFGTVPDLHMLRGMRLAGGRWPFTSADSTDIARNHNHRPACGKKRYHLPHNTPAGMALRWQERAALTARAWTPPVISQQDLFA